MDKIIELRCPNCGSLKIEEVHGNNFDIKMKCNKCKAEMRIRKRVSRFVNVESQKEVRT